MKMKPGMAKIKLSSNDHTQLEEITAKIVRICKGTDASFKGPIRLPTKHCIVPVRKSPDGEGTETWERWEYRLHNRLMYVEQKDRALHKIFRIELPDGVAISVNLTR